VDEVAAQPSRSTDTLFIRGAYYTQARADEDFGPVYTVLQNQLNALPSQPVTYNSVNAAGYFLDHLSIYEWIEKYVPGGHKSPLGLYLDSAYCQEYGVDTPLQSSLNLVYLLGYQPGTYQPPGPWQIYGLSDERFSIAGGNQRLPEAIAAALPAGSVVTQSALTRIARMPNGQYALTLKGVSGSRMAEADEVILALPFSVLRTLDYSSAGFDPLKITAIKELGYGTNTKLSLLFNNRYWNTTGPWGIGDGNIYTDLFFQNTWDSSRGLSNPMGVLTAFMGGTNAASFTNVSSPYATTTMGNTPTPSDPTVATPAKAFLSLLNQVWPGVDAHWRGTAALSTPWSDPNLLGAYACWTVGQYTKFAGYERVAQPAPPATGKWPPGVGTCHFAGEHCSINYQGFMEGGAEEGARAANEIINKYT